MRASERAPLYARVLRDRFDQLPACVRAIHLVLRDSRAHGHAIVVRGRNPIARLVAAMIGFPDAGEHPLHVNFTERDGIETWERDFAGRRFRSHLSERDGRLVERFGFFRFAFDLPCDDRGLTMVLRRWWMGPLPLPLSLAPRSEAREWEAEGRFQFDVPISLPLIGLIVHYRGWLKIIEDQ